MDAQSVLKSAKKVAGAAAESVADIGVTAWRETLRFQIEKYNRLTVDVRASAIPDEPCLFLSHHGFGGPIDLNVYAAFDAIERISDRPVKILTHDINWQLGGGPFVERFGAIRASHEAAEQAFKDGYHVLVMPGGDLDAMKAWKDRNTLGFHGRTGFVELARSVDAPVVPIVTAGGAEAVVMLSQGKGIAKAFDLKKRMRLNVVPVTLSMPWGFSVFSVGILPFMPIFPLPTKLETVILEPRTLPQDTKKETLANDLEKEMQDVLTELTKGRVPFVGRVSLTA